MSPSSSPSPARARAAAALLALLACGAAPGCKRAPELPAPPLSLIDDLGLVPPDPGDASAALSTPPPRDGNRVRLLTDGEASFAARRELIAGAERSIYLQTLIFKADATGRDVADQLLARKRADPSLDIRVIVDAYANVADLDAQLLYLELQNAGIDVEGFEAFYLHWLNEIDLQDWLAGNKRYHEKYLVVDGQRAVVGGMNIADEYARCSADPMLRWRDQDVLLDGPVAADVEAAFLDNHAAFKAAKQAKPELFDPDRYWTLWREQIPGADALLAAALEAGHGAREVLGGGLPPADCDGTPVPSEPVDGVRARFLRSRPRVGENPIHAAYLKLVEGATSHVDLVNAYFVPPPELVDALVAAAARGVRVRVITNSRETNDIPLITDAARTRYAALIASGVAVHEWHGERFDEGTLHAKFAVFDERVALIGSYNLDPRSRSLNSEDAVLLEDPTVAGALARHVDEHDLPMTDRITAADADAWTDPALLPAPAVELQRWTSPAFDADLFEYALLRALEPNL